MPVRTTGTRDNMGWTLRSLDSRRLMCGHLICARMLDKTRVLSDASGFEPDDNGGKNHHRPVVDCALFIARGESTPLLEPIDTALDHIPAGVDRLVEGERTTRPSRPLGALIAALRDRVRDLPLAQQATTARVAVPFVSDEPRWAGPRSSAPSRPRDTNASQHQLQLRTIVALPWCDHDRQRSSFAVAGEVHLACQPAATASKPLVGWVLDPFFSSA